MNRLDLDALNAMPAQDFVAALGGVFEHSPWVAEAVVDRRPFADTAALHAGMCDAVAQAGRDRQLELIRAHPELAGRAAIAGELTEASRGEQAGAGLDRCTPAEYAELHALNDAYRTRFGFPFILAVRGHTRHSIIASLRQRLANPRQDEIDTALQQIERIAALRLTDMLGD
jgi:2-oxo-4-hydroxy-4-carboxy-5-ureidoimidazoline decarboxylase